MLFSGMNTVPEGSRTETWRQRYLASRYRQEFVANRSGKQPADADKAGEREAAPPVRPRPMAGPGQAQRHRPPRDRAQTAILLAQAPLFALLVALVNYPSARRATSTRSAQKLPVVHFLMVVAAIWFGCNNAARDIVGEWTIYKRERMVTLKLLPYVFSKFAVLLGPVHLPVRLHAGHRLPESADCTATSARTSSSCCSRP